MNNSFEEMILETRMRAYTGDSGYGNLLVGQLQNRERGLEVARAFNARIPINAFREILDFAWTLDHYEVRKAAKKEATLRKWFQYAAFDISHSEQLTLYRGGMCFISKDAIMQNPISLSWGESWTLDRDVACFFALIYSRRTAAGRIPNAYPCVVSVQAPRSYAQAYFTDRSESEVIAFTRRLQGHIVDGLNLPVREAATNSWRPSEELLADWLVAGERCVQRTAELSVEI